MWNFNFHPQTITEAIRQIVIVAITFGVLNWTMEQQGMVIQAVSAILSLFARSTTISTGKMDQRVEERVAQRDAGLPGPSGPTM